MSRYRRQKMQPPPSVAPPMADDLGAVLDAVNAWGALEQRSEMRLAAFNLYGPGVFRGPVPVEWAGVCLWYKLRGYHHYAVLHLLGIWAMRAGEQIELRLGVRDLHYQLPLFNAESYYHRIQREFKTFYADNGAPAENSRLHMIYEPDKRLEIRRALEAALDVWAAEAESA